MLNSSFSSITEPSENEDVFYFQDFESQNDVPITITEGRWKSKIFVIGDYPHNLEVTRESKRTGIKTTYFKCMNIGMLPLQKVLFFE